MYHICMVLISFCKDRYKQQDFYAWRLKRITYEVDAPASAKRCIVKTHREEVLCVARGKDVGNDMRTRRESASRK